MKRYTIEELKEMVDESLSCDISDCQICTETASAYFHVCSDCLKGIIEELIEFREK